MIIIPMTDSPTSTTILGYPVGSPFFISPCSRASYGHPRSELNLVEGAAAADILYIVSPCVESFPLPNLCREYQYS